MSSARLFRVAGYLPSGGGRYAAHLEPAELDAGATPGCTTLWSSALGEGKAGLRRVLTEPANRELMALLSGEPEVTVEQAMSLPGGAESLDVALLLRRARGPDGLLLLLIDCEPAGATKPSRLRIQCARAMRSCRSVISNLRFEGPPPQARLVLLAPWRPGLEPPWVRHRPAWDGTAVPRPAWWGYLPLRAGEDELVAFGRWQTLGAQPWAHKVALQSSAWLKTEAPHQLPASRAMRSIEFAVDLGESSVLTFLLDRGPFRVRLRVPAIKHRRTLLDPRREDPATRRLRRLRDAVYEGRWGPTGWSFSGEITDGGATWLAWRWTRSPPQGRTDWVVANEEAEAFAITLKMFLAGG